MKRIFTLLGLFIAITLSASTGKEVIRHRVAPKETLFRIALMYNSTVRDIEKANPGIDPRSVNYGSVIKVPKDTKIRDAQFVESFLNGSPEYPSIAQVASLITKEKPSAKTTSNITSARIAQPIDDNPFLTPSEPRGGQIADEQPAITSEPASADKNQAIEDENPFMSPKSKSIDTKGAAKPAAKSNNAEIISSTNE